MTPFEKEDLDNMKAKVLQREGEVEEKEDEIYAEAAPKGDFKTKALNSLVMATNKLLPLFGINEEYDKFTTDAKELPPEFVRLLTMFAKAIDDAVAEGVLPEDAVIDMSIVTDDSGLLSLAGRIGMAASSKELKRFLSRKITEEEAPAPMAMEEVVDVDNAEDTDTLFEERM